MTIKLARKLSLLTLFFLVAIFIVPSSTAIAKNHQQANNEQEETHELPAEHVQRFVSAFGRIKNFYVKPVTDEELFEAAIRGMLTSLDPHSAYLTEDDYKNLQTTTTGEFGGLGIEIEMEDGFLKVVSPIDDTPAARAGIMPGDLIIAIDNKPVKGMTIRQAVKKMRGPKGSKITLMILRNSKSKPLKVSLVRDVIKIQSIKGKIINTYYGYIRISHFQSPTAKNLIKMVKQLKKETKGKLRGLVLDLRNNPGGLLESAIDVADAFLDTKNKLKYEELIVYTKGRVEGTELKVNASPGDILKGLPLVVLINAGSASGSEIVAGALQDHQRAIIIGERTFGKGSVQTVLPLDHGHGIKLTTALYYTPSGRSIQAKGIQPDITIDNIEIPQKDGKALDIISIREAQLRGHLENGNKLKKDKSQSKNDKNQKSKPEKGKPLIHTDFQLYEALNLLKAMHHIGIKY